MAIELSEHDVQRWAVRALRETRVKFFAVPNGGLRNKATALKLWQEGVQAGVPDLIILDRPSTGAVGTALEFKRRKGGVVSAQQEAWLQAFRERGWEARIVCGLAEFYAVMQELGYPMPQGATAGDSTAPSPTGADLGRGGSAPSASTQRPRRVPKRGTGGAG